MSPRFEGPAGRPNASETDAVEQRRKKRIEELDKRIGQAEAMAASFQRELDIRNQMKDAASTGKGFGAVGLPVFAEWFGETLKETDKWFNTHVVPTRKRRGLTPIVGHGMEMRNLLGASNRNQQTASAGGVLKDGFRGGDFGLYAGTGGNSQLGERFYQDAFGDERKFARNVWMITDRESVGDSSRILGRSLMVFPDPRALLHHLRKVRDGLAAGETILDHQACAWEEYLKFLGENGGKLPHEVTP